jgi:7-cyano-7-deazaguanine synthase
VGGDAVVLLSGGLDSALNLAIAAADQRAKLAVTCTYGQRAEAQELRAAEQLASYYRVPWQRVDLSWLGQAHPNALTRKQQGMPDLATKDLDNLEKGKVSAKAVWVANRNGVFLNVAAVYAEALGASSVLVGFNREEAATFPDNSAAYVHAANQAFAFSTSNSVRVESYSLNWDKREIMAKAREIKLPIEMLWSCYESGPEPCGVCESCRRFQRAQSFFL